LTTTPNTNLTGRLGRWSASHWKTATFGWLLFVIVAFMVGNAVTRHMLDPQKAGAGESGHVQAVLADEWAQPKSEAVIVEAKHGSSSDPQFRAAVDDLIGHLRAMKQVAKVQSPYAAGYEKMRSKDGRTVLVGVDLRETDLAEAQKTVVPVQREVDRVARAHPEAEFNQFGDASSEKEVNGAINQDLEKAGMLSLPVTLAVLLITFGALVAAGLPLLLGLSAVFATMGLLALPSGIVPLDPQAGVIVLLIGLAVGVDYSMFYVKRADEEHRAGRSRREAVEIAAATSGRAVLISGLTVTLAMAGMLFTGDKTFMSFGVAAALVVIVAVLGSLTVLPALLARLGDKIDRIRLPRMLRPRCGSGRMWNVILRPVLRHPAISATLATGVLVALAIPAVQMHSAKPEPNMLPPQLKVSTAFDKMLTAFPSGNAVTPAQVMVKTDRLDSQQAQDAIDQLKRQAIASGKFTTPVEVDVSPKGNIALVSLPIVGGSTDGDKRSKQAIDTLRSTIVPHTVGTIEDVDVGVTGGAASNEDFDAQFRNAAPFVFAFVLGFAFILLLVTFRSIVIAIKAIVLNLLSVAAAYGVLVLVFQHGWGKQVLDFEYTGGIFGFLPIFLFVILFGLSMDYHVFIISRIREAYDAGMSNEEAVTFGIRSTAGVVTSAALVMVGVFAIFASLQFIFLKQFGVGLAVAILLDATLVRAVLLPASMKLLGDWNWYLPRWLSWLPSFEPEVAVAPAPTAPAATA
jgi:uncharacterized membrane protein YdfJ with MMPL/SSD domain